MVSVARFKVFVFDFDGVIIHSEGLQARAWTRLAGELGRPREVRVGEVAGKLDRVIAPELFPAHGDHNWCVTRKRLIERELETAEGIAYIEASLELARRLSGTHRLAVCSSSGPGRIREVLERAGVGSLFAVIVGQEKGDECKPSPAPYLKVLRLMGARAGEACALEDSATGLTAAKGAGLFAIQLLHEGMERCDLADEVVRSAAEIGV